MAKHRQISSDFWSDTYIEELKPTEKLLFLHLITNDKNNVAGIYEITPKKIGYETGLDSDMVAKMIKSFSEKDKIHYVDNYILIVNFYKYTPKNKDVLKAIHKVIDDLPQSVIAFICSQTSRIYDNIKSQFLHPVDTLLTERVSFNKNKNKDKDKNKDKKKEREEIPQGLKTTNDIKREWNDFAVQKGLPQVVKLTDDRKKKLKLRLQDPDFKFGEILEAISASPFCLGKSKEGWKVSLDFVIANESNYLKILEGRYSDTRKTAQTPSPPSISEEESLRRLEGY